MTTLAAAATFSSSPLWFLTRSTGLIAFALLTVATVLGIAATQRALASPSWPRFATQQLHRNVSLLSLVFLVAHIVTTLLDSYVTVGWTSLVIPFLSPYHRLWVGVGTIASDLMLAIVVTSLWRTRVSARVWRAVHYLSYVAWPFALGHYLFNGTDAVNGGWGLYARAAHARPRDRGRRRAPHHRQPARSPRQHQERPMIPPTITPPRLIAPTATTLQDHLQRYGTVPSLTPATILGEVDASGLVGAAAQGFPPAARCVPSQQVPGLPSWSATAARASRPAAKDALLLERSPHLVLDGLQVAATAVGADQVHLVVHARHRRRCANRRVRRSPNDAGRASTAYRSSCTASPGATSPARSPRSSTSSTGVRPSRCSRRRARTRRGWPGGQP